ncbi:hypothetical protein PIB30_069782 [Stylosanthes scabra]|uniref:Uncharacterized protein n=1 Tax=Stylosanthes scabra TaxID=79078 RepID=A0ABU6SNC9_9FABA|nr:hypothetical protein [Stylosanthes scabra]
MVLLNMMMSLEECNGSYMKHKALFVFGDSLYDPGNNLYLQDSNKTDHIDIPPSDHCPYGQTFFNHPTGRFSDGRIVPDFIEIIMVWEGSAATFAGLPIVSAYLKPQHTPFTYGANFASAGAAATIASNSNIWLPRQVKYFKDVVKSLKEEVGDRRAERVLKDAVYLFSIGGNDYNLLHRVNPNASKSYTMAFVNKVVNNLTGVFKEIYSLGGRKFGYQNVGPLGCSPSSRVIGNGECDPILMEMASLHNKAFTKALNNLHHQLPGFRYALFDYYNALLDRINHPSKYGLKEGKVACCGNRKKFEVCKNPSEYVWFDFAHPVEKVNNQIAMLFWSASPNVTAPYNVSQLFN